MALPDGAIAVFAVATRITQIDENGFPVVGSGSYTTDQLIEAKLAPTLETGDDIAIKGASGELVALAKHGDMPKYYTVTVDLSIPDPNIEALLCGGTVLGSSAAALGAQEIKEAEGGETGGTLVAGVYGYKVTGYNVFGETAASPEKTVTIAGGTKGRIFVVPKQAAIANCIGFGVYGRTPGGESRIGTVPCIGLTPPENKAIAAEPISEIKLEAALTVPIPAGTQFVISNDAAKPKQVFTTTKAAGVGATALAIETVIATVVAAKGKIEPCFADTGAVTPFAAPPLVDGSAGIQNIGYQAPPLGITGNPNGVSLEFWEKALLRGGTPASLPYWRIVMPQVKNFVAEDRDMKNALMANKYKGEGFANQNWGTGPFGDWPFDSTKVVQRSRVAGITLPKSSLSPTEVPF